MSADTSAMLNRMAVLSSSPGIIGESWTLLGVTSAAIFPAQAPAGTPRRGLSGPATGEFIYDLDLDVTDVEGLRAACIAWLHTHIVATYVSGEGLWLVLKGPVTTTRDQYSAAQRALFPLIPEYIRRHIAENQANLDRLRYISSDPDIFYNPDAPDVPDVDVAVNAEPDQSGATVRRVGR